MFVVVTLNPTLDKIIITKNFLPNRTLRVSSVHLVTSGKGINVARALRFLGENTISIGFLGGPNGQYIENKLKEEGLPANFIRIKGNTRSNTTILDTNSATETHLVEPGPRVSKEETAGFLKKFRQVIKKSHGLILSGSLPQGIPPTFYAKLIKEAKNKGVMTILDSSGKGLVEGIKAGPFMVKPNHLELEDVTGRKLKTVNSIVKATHNLTRQGIEIALTSLGKEGSVLANGKKIWQALPPRNLKAINSVGAGDTLTAGFIHYLNRGKKIEEALRLGAAAATASVLTQKTGLFKKKDLKDIYRKITIKQIS